MMSPPDSAQLIPLMGAIIQVLAGLLATIAIALASWSIKQIVTLTTRQAAFEAEVRGELTAGRERFQDIKGELRDLNKKLDDMRNALDEERRKKG